MEHIALEVGCGEVPRVYSSGGKTRYGRTSQDVNRYPKWAYTEAGNVVAVGAVGRHLAEATYWVLKRSEPYRDPKFCSGRSGA